MNSPRLLTRRRVDAAPTHASARKHPLAPRAATPRADCSCASPARGGGHRRREGSVSRSRTGFAPRGRTTTRQLSYAVSWRRRTRWRRRRVVRRGDARSLQQVAAPATATAQRAPASRGCDAPQRGRNASAARRVGGGAGWQRRRAADRGTSKVPALPTSASASLSPALAV